jgi:hypothetical protein
LRTTYISSSILYRSGSTKFGDELTDNHEFTGSLLVSGSSHQINGSTIFTTPDDVRITLTDSGDGSSLVFRADSTNEIYTNSNHDLQIYTNGNQNGQLFLNQSTNRVGIGETNPENKLHVNSGGTNIAAKFESTDGTGGIALVDSTGNVELTTSGTNGFNIQPGGGSTVFRVESDGKVGINTAPAALLHINGEGDAIRVTSTNAGAGGAQLDLLHFSPSPANNDTMSYINMGGYYSGTNSAYFSSIRTVATDVAGRNGEIQFWAINAGTLAKRVVFDTLGKIGVGIDSPSDKLHIKNTTGDAGITLEGPSQTLRVDQNSIRTSTNSPINIFTNSTSGTNSFYIGNDGRFGVGTTTPTSGTKLDVAGKIRATDDLILSQTSPRIDYDGGNTGSLRFLSTSTGNVTMTLLSSGLLTLPTTVGTSKFNITSGGITKQHLVNSKSAASSGTALKLFYVGFSHAVRLYLYILQDSNNIATAVADFTSAYGASSGGITVFSRLGNISSISASYDNGGSPAYTINVTVNYSGAAPTIYASLEGISNGEMYLVN